VGVQPFGALGRAPTTEEQRKIVEERDQERFVLHKKKDEACKIQERRRDQGSAPKEKNEEVKKKISKARNGRKCVSTTANEMSQREKRKEEKCDGSGVAITDSLLLDIMGISFSL
jgi:hypothetical protein